MIPGSGWSSRAGRTWSAVWVALVFFLTLAPVWPGLDFPYFYHADEPIKVRQIISGDWNFHHPVLMLDTVDTALLAFGTPMEAQSVVEFGRRCAAIFMAAAVAVTTGLAIAYGGLLAGVFAGLLLCVQPDVFELAHYLKEDPFMALGVALTLWGISAFARRPDVFRIACAGAAAGLTASGKYVGAVFLLPVIVVALAQGPAPVRVRIGRALAALLAAVAVFAVINAPMLMNLEEVRTSFGRETNLVLKGQAGISRDIPHIGFVQRFFQRVGLLLPLYAAGLAWLWSQRRRMDAGAWVLVSMPWLIVLVLSFSAKDSGRYFLPAALGIGWTLGLGCAATARWVSAWLRAKGVAAPVWGVAVLVGAYAGTVALERFREPWKGYQGDARKQLLLFINEKLPSDAVIMQGRKVNLPAPDNEYRDAWHIPAGRKILCAPQYIANVADTPQDLRAKGVTHVAMGSDEFARYLRKGAKPMDSKAELFAQRRAFYGAVVTEGELVWQSERLKIGTHNPDIRLYRLPDPAPR